MDAAVITELSSIIGRAYVFNRRRDLLAYEYDATGGRRMPDVVVFPANTAEVAAVLRLAEERRVPVVPRGAGTNLSGGTIPVAGGLVLELSRMNRILEIDVANRRAVVEPCVVNLDLQNALAPLGYFYAPDPASQKVSTLGGNAAENSGGPHCLKYGVTSNHILGLELVLMGGEIVEVGVAGSMQNEIGHSRAAQASSFHLSAPPSAGYDLTGLMVGSEGTFGVITRITVRLTRLPEKVQTMLAAFDHLEDAGDAVSDIIAAGIVPATLELMDRAVVRAVEASVHAGYPMDAEAVLLIEVDGIAAALPRQMQQIAEACHRHSAREVRLAHSEEERERLWLGRRGAIGAVARVKPSYSVQDGTVPRTRLTDALRAVGRIAEQNGIVVGNIAHAGDGNLHPLFMFDPAVPAEVDGVHRAGKEILEVCVELGGTLTGEHGIGIEKLASAGLLFGPPEVEMARKIKQVFDPAGLLNPGKAMPFDDDAMSKEGADGKEPAPTIGLSLSKRKLNTTAWSEVSSGERASQSSPLPLEEGKDEGSGQTYPIQVGDALASICGREHLLTDSGELTRFSAGDWRPPLAVLPSAIDELTAVVRLANEARLPLIPIGTGACLRSPEFQAPGAVVVSSEKMNQILDLDVGNQTVLVQAGCSLTDLDRELRRYGLWLPLYSDAFEQTTIGALLASDSAGPCRLRYGTARDYLLGLKIVTPTGEVVRTGGKTVKDVAGYDLRKLFIGSRGTLGVIVETTLRLLPLPEARAGAFYAFATSAEAQHFTETVLSSQLIPSCLELIQGAAAEIVLDRCARGDKGAAGRDGHGKRERTLLFVGLEGMSEDVEYQLAKLAAMVREHDGEPLVGGRGEAEVVVDRDAEGLAAPALAADDAWSLYEATRREMASSGPKAAVLPAGPKRGESERSDYGLMRAIKRALDPNGVLPPFPRPFKERAKGESRAAGCNRWTQ